MKKENQGKKNNTSILNQAKKTIQSKEFKQASKGLFASLKKLRDSMDVFK